MLFAVVTSTVRNVLVASPGWIAEVSMGIRTLPETLSAVVWGLAHGGVLSRRGDLIVVGAMRGGHGPSEAVTVGSVVLTSQRPSEVSAALLRHEARHRDQWALLGPTAFPIAYGAAQEVATHLLHAGPRGNVFEIAAGLDDGGYQRPRGGAAAEELRLVRFVTGTNPDERRRHRHPPGGTPPQPLTRTDDEPHRRSPPRAA